MKRRSVVIVFLLILTIFTGIAITPSDISIFIQVDAQDPFDCGTNIAIGIQYWPSGCTINTPTTWGNGTITIKGNIQVNADFNLWNVIVKLDLSFDEEYTLLANVAGVDINWFQGSIQSNTSFTTRVDMINIDDIIIRNGTHKDVTWDLRNGDSTVWLENNTFGPSDARDALDGQHMWLSPNATVRWNTFQGILVHDGAVMVSRQNWGDILIEGNEIGMQCMPPIFLTNCMGVEVISSQDERTAIAPFPAVNIAWNNFTFEAISPNTDSNFVDIEFSDRVWVHNNTGRINEANNSDKVTEFLLSGGARDSIFENNTGYGISEAGDAWSYCFFQFIYSNANNIWQYNECDDVERMVINANTGGTEYRHNIITNVSRAGFWFCDNCLGDPNGAGNSYFYNNSFTWKGATAMISTDPPVVNKNTYILHGSASVNQWGDNAENPPFHEVPGLGWFLYHAEDSIEQLVYENKSNGDFIVRMEADGTGRLFHDTYPNFGATDNAKLSIVGNIDIDGSRNQNDNLDGTYLWDMGRDRTNIIINAQGLMQFNVENYFPSTGYNVDIWNVSNSQWENTSFTTDGSGDGGFNKAFSNNQYNVTIRGVGEPPSWTNTAPQIDQTFTSREGTHNVSYEEPFTANDPDTNQTLGWYFVFTNASFLGLEQDNRSSWVNGTPLFADTNQWFYVELEVYDAGCSDSCNLTDSLNYTLWINNTIPTITNKINHDAGITGTFYERTWTYSDVNGDTVSWSIDTNTGLNIGSTNGTVWGNLPSAGIQYNINVSLTEAAFGFADWNDFPFTSGQGCGFGVIALDCGPTVVQFSLIAAFIAIAAAMIKFGKSVLDWFERLTKRQWILIIGIAASIVIISITLLVVL